MAECQLIRGGAEFHGKQGLDYIAGISAETAGAQAICMHLLEIPPGVSAGPHYHEAHETAILVLEGAAEMRHGPNLELVMRMEAGDFRLHPGRCASSALQPDVNDRACRHCPHRSKRARERRRGRRRRLELTPRREGQ